MFRLLVLSTQTFWLQSVKNVSCLDFSAVLSGSKISQRKTVRLAALGWLISHSLSLFYPNALFWDDWLFYTSTPIDFSEGGVREWCCWPRDILESSLLGIHNGVFRALTFVLFPLIALTTRKILGTFGNSVLTEHEKDLYVVLTLLLPANSARIATISFQWTLSLFVFSLAAFLWTTRRSLPALLLAIPLFLFSFRMSSLLVFSLVPSVLAAVDWYFRKPNKSYFRSFLAMTPVVLAILYRAFISDNGSTEGYNEIQVGGLLRSVLLLAGFFSVYGFLFKAHSRLQISMRSVNQIAIGLAILWLGAMPYMSVGHLSGLSDWTTQFFPGQGDWYSRHQILLPFGLSMLILGLFNILEGRAMSLLMPLVLAVSVTFNFLFSTEYLIDARKQEAVIAAFRELSELNEVKVVYIQEDPSAARLNARARQIREYEFTGLLRRAIGPTAPTFLDEEMTTENSCKKPTQVPVYRIIAPTDSFTKLKTLLHMDLELAVARSSTLVCLDESFQS